MGTYVKFNLPCGYLNRLVPRLHSAAFFVLQVTKAEVEAWERGLYLNIMCEVNTGRKLISETGQITMDEGPTQP